MKAAVLLCIVVLAVRPAHALESCFTDSLGSWRGQVLSAGRIEQIDTVFTLTADDKLVATYHIGGADSLDGRLTDFTPTGPCEAVFVWHDGAGVGVVDIDFDPAHGHFHGVWGEMSPVPGQVFDGDRLSPGS